MSETSDLELREELLASAPTKDDTDSQEGGKPGVRENDGLRYRLDRRKNFSRRLSSLVFGWAWHRRHDGQTYDYRAATSDDDADSVLEQKLTSRSPRSRRSIWLSRLRRAALASPFVVLMLFGVLHIVLVMLGGKDWFADIEEYRPHTGGDRDRLWKHRTGVTKGVLPIPCHSHNDYWRKPPLFAALRTGCTSIEADVWYLDDGEGLYVGHRKHSLNAKKTLKSLYIDPLVSLLEDMNANNKFDSTSDNGIFDEDPSQTLVLLVDFKSDGHALLPEVSRQLEPLRSRDYLSYWDGNNFISRAITIVASGDAPFDDLNHHRQYRDIFFDAPLDEMYEPAAQDPTSGHHQHRSQGKTGTDSISTPNAFNTSNSYYASTSFSSSIGTPWTGRLSAHQLDLLRGQIRGAKRRGLKARYWETPAWPTSLRNHVWEVLVREGAEVLTVDDLYAAAYVDWTAHVGHGWFDA